MTRPPIWSYTTIFGARVLRERVLTRILRETERVTRLLDPLDKAPDMELHCRQRERESLDP